MAKVLLFSSVGDVSDQWLTWLDGERNYECAFCYYGQTWREILHSNPNFSEITQFETWNEAQRYL